MTLRKSSFIKVIVAPLAISALALTGLITYLDREEAKLAAFHAAFDKTPEVLSELAQLGDAALSAQLHPSSVYTWTLGATVRAELPPTAELASLGVEEISVKCTYKEDNPVIAEISAALSSFTSKSAFLPVQAIPSFCGLLDPTS